MIEVWIVTLLLHVVRLATFWFVAPVWGDRRAPRTVKIGLVLALTWFWASNLDTVSMPVIQIVSNGSWLVLAIAVVREMLIGLLLGIAFYVFVEPARIAGAYVGQELGLSMATQADPASAESNNIVSTLIQTTVFLFILSWDFHHFIILCLDASFERIPVGSTWSEYPSLLLTQGLSATVDQGISMVAPIGVMLFVVLASLMLLARAVPSLNLFSIGLSIRVVAGLFALFLFLPQLIQGIQVVYVRGQGFIESIVQVLAP